MLLWHPEVLESDVKISDNKNPSRCYIWEKNPSRCPDRDYRFREPSKHHGKIKLNLFVVIHYNIQNFEKIYIEIMITEFWNIFNIETDFMNNIYEHDNNTLCNQLIEKVTNWQVMENSQLITFSNLGGSINQHRSR